MVTIGQYLKPRAGCLEVARFWRPEEFEALKADALALGFAAVQAGVYVRSSYYAGQMLKEIGR
jgi:lipoic acid synthetase